MSNNNGLTSLAPVYVTGANDSNIWASKVAPIITSSVTLESTDGTNTAVINESNGGDLTLRTSDSTFGDIILQNTGNIYLQPGTTIGAIAPAAPRAVYVGMTQPGAVLIIKNESTGIPDGTCKVILEDTSSNGKTFEMASTANTFYISDIEDTESILTSTGAAMTLLSTSAAPVINIGTAPGRLYDSVYNPVASVTVLQAPITGNIVYDVAATRPAGIYQLQLSVESVVKAGSATNALTILATAPPSTQIVNFSGHQVLPAAVGTILCMNSGYFTHPGGSMRVEVRATDGGIPSTPWSGDWVLQLVKIG